MYCIIIAMTYDNNNSISFKNNILSTFFLKSNSTKYHVNY